MDIGDPELTLLGHLGSGGFGAVYKCKSIRKNEPQIVVVKRLHMTDLKQHLKNFVDEVYIFSQLRHPRIVGFIRSYLFSNTANIVMEYMPYGTLKHTIADAVRMNQYPLFNSKQLSQYFCDILMGLEYLHIRHVFHRDLKPENILLDERKRVKISDFGIATVLEAHRDRQTVAGTYYYMAPEIHSGAQYDFRSDIWSLGCVLYEICMGSSPFFGARSVDELQRMKCRKLDFSSVGQCYDSVWQRICEETLRYKPENRITLSGLVCIDPRITMHYYHLYFDYQQY